MIQDDPQGDMKKMLKSPSFQELSIEVKIQVEWVGITSPRSFLFPHVLS